MGGSYRSYRTYRAYRTYKIQCVNCPKCGHVAAFGAEECERCGVIFSRVRVPRRYELEDEVVRDGRMGPAEWKILGGGLAAAILVYAIPFTRFVFSAIVTLFHEFGH